MTLPLPLCPSAPLPLSKRWDMKGNRSGQQSHPSDFAFPSRWAGFLGSRDAPVLLMLQAEVVHCWWPGIHPFTIPNRVPDWNPTATSMPSRKWWEGRIRGALGRARASIRLMGDGDARWLSSEEMPPRLSAERRMVSMKPISDLCLACHPLPDKLMSSGYPPTACAVFPPLFWGSTCILKI